MGALALVVYRLGGDGAACSVLLLCFLGWGCLVLHCFAFFGGWDLASLISLSGITALLVDWLGLMAMFWLGGVGWFCSGFGFGVHFRVVGGVCVLMGRRVGWRALVGLELFRLSCLFLGLVGRFGGGRLICIRVATMGGPFT